MDDEALLATVGRGAEAEERRTEAKACRGHRMAPTLPAILVVGVVPTTITITGTFFYPNPELWAQRLDIFLMENFVEKSKSFASLWVPCTTAFQRPEEFEVNICDAF